MGHYQISISEGEYGIECVMWDEDRVMVFIKLESEYNHQLGGG
jgi:hypothetical protein